MNHNGEEWPEWKGIKQTFCLQVLSWLWTFTNLSAMIFFGQHLAPFWTFRSFWELLDPRGGSHGKQQLHVMGVFFVLPGAAGLCGHAPGSLGESPKETSTSEEVWSNDGMQLGQRFAAELADFIQKSRFNWPQLICKSGELNKIKLHMGHHGPQNHQQFPTRVQPAHPVAAFYFDPGEKCSVDLMHSLVPHAALPEYRFRGMHLKMSAVHAACLRSFGNWLSFWSNYICIVAATPLSKWLLKCNTQDHSTV